MAAKLSAEELAAMLGEVKATATEYDKNFCRQHLRLIKCGTEENPEELAEKKAAAAARAKLLSSVCRSKADCIKWSGGWVLLEYHGKLDKRCNGVAARRRKKLELKHGGLLTAAEKAWLEDIVSRVLLEEELKELQSSARGRNSER